MRNLQMRSLQLEEQEASHKATFPKYRGPWVIWGGFWMKVLHFNSYGKAEVNKKVDLRKLLSQEQSKSSLDLADGSGNMAHLVSDLS